MKRRLKFLFIFSITLLIIVILVINILIKRYAQVSLPSSASEDIIEEEEMLSESSQGEPESFSPLNLEGELDIEEEPPLGAGPLVN